MSALLPHIYAANNTYAKPFARMHEKFRQFDNE